MVHIITTAYLRSLLSLCQHPKSTPTSTTAPASAAAPATQDRTIPPQSVQELLTPSLSPALTFMGFSSYVGVPRSISASCSRLASSPGLSQVGGSHWVCLEKGRQTDQRPFLFHPVPSLQLSNSNPEAAITLVTTLTSLPRGSSRSSPLDRGLFSSWVGGQLFWVLEGMEEASPGGYWSPQALAENSTKRVKRNT